MRQPIALPLDHRRTHSQDAHLRLAATRIPRRMADAIGVGHLGGNPARLFLQPMQVLHRVIGNVMDIFARWSLSAREISP